MQINRLFSHNKNMENSQKLFGKSKKMQRQRLADIDITFTKEQVKNKL